MTIVSALKKLHKKMTGKDATGLNIAGVIDSLQANYTGGGGGGDTYETVAEIAVGTMVEQEGFYVYIESDVAAPGLDATETYYLNDEENPSEFVTEPDGGVQAIGFNFSSQEDPVRIDQSKPLTSIVWSEGGITVASDADDLANTTVKILKKVSGGGSSDDKDFIVSGTLVLTDGIPSGVGQLNHSLNEVLGALQSDKDVTLIASTEGSVDKVTLSLPCVFGTDGAAVFSGTGYDSNSNMNLHVTVIYTNDDATLLLDFMPRISGSDDGKILTAQNGVYMLVSPSGLPNTPLIVHGTVSNGVLSVTDADLKTIYDAKAANRAVFLDDSEEYRWGLSGAEYFSNDNVYALSFGTIRIDKVRLVPMVSLVGFSGGATDVPSGSVMNCDLTPNA